MTGSIAAQNVSQLSRGGRIPELDEEGNASGSAAIADTAARRCAMAVAGAAILVEKARRKHAEVVWDRV